MRAYLKKMSYRPGCSCCNINKGLFAFKPRHHTSPTSKNAKRAGKKQMRQRSKQIEREAFKEMDEQFLEDMKFLGYYFGEEI